MRLRPALLATCLSAAGACGSDRGAAAQRNATPPTVYPAPPSPAPVPPAQPIPRRPMAPEVAEALKDARATEQLLMRGSVEEAIANYRRAVAEPPEGEVAGVASMRTIHLSALASLLIRLGRSDDADRLLQEFVDSPPPTVRERNLSALLEMIDRRIYIASGRGDADGVVALLGQRASLEPSDSPLACVDPPYLPFVVAPMHHDARVLAALRRFGCQEDVIEQIERLAQDPIEAAIPLPAPGRRRGPRNGGAD